MNEQVKQIAARIRELREILDIPQEEVAKKKQEIADKKAQYKAKKDERKETNST